jgi:uncharacterized membrane protein
MTRKILVFCALATIAAASLAATTPIYKWRDARGMHYSDKPPPQGATIIRLNYHAADPKAVETAVARAQDTLKEDTKQRQAQQQAAKAAAHAKAVRRARCADARHKLKTLQGARRVRRIGADGKSTFYSGENLVKLRQTIQARADKFCK